MCAALERPTLVRMVAPLIGSPRRPVRRLDALALDVGVVVASLAGTIAAILVIVQGSRQMCLPDSDGLEALGVALGIGGVMLLVPGIVCTLTGLWSARRGPRIAGRVLLLFVVLTWPILLPAWIGLAFMSAVPSLWSC